MKTVVSITKDQALELISKNKPVMNIITGYHYTYTYGMSATCILPMWILDLPKEGWITWESIDETK
jgi:hypothetical protein